MRRISTPVTIRRATTADARAIAEVHTEELRGTPLHQVRYRVARV